MKTEIEVKFLSVDFDGLRAKLKELGAELEQPMRLMRRQIFYLVDRSNMDAYLRVRDEGDKVTMTYKQFDEIGLHGAKEIEVEVSDFTDTVAMIKHTGLQPKSYQETRRETWRVGTTEVVLDEWPWLKPFIEIEGESEADVRQVADKLGYSWDDAVFGAVTEAYRRQYDNLPDDFIMDNVPEILFDAPLPDRLKT